MQKTRHADGTRRNRSAPPGAVDSARCRPRQPRALRVSPIFRRATPSPCHLEGAADRSGPRFAGRGGGRHGAESRRIDGPRRLVKSPAAPHHQGDAGSHRGNRPDALFADHFFSELTTVIDTQRVPGRSTPDLENSGVWSLRHLERVTRELFFISSTPDLE